MAVATAPQLRFMERTLDDTELAAQLEEWQEAKDDLKPYRERFTARDKQVKQVIKELALADGDYRVGRFAIRIREAEERHIEFERASNKRMTIKLIEDD
jgi:hypothetical protein